MKSLILAFGLSLFLAVPQDLGDNLKDMKRLRDDTPEDVLQEVAEDGSKEALDGLIEFYPTLATIYTRIQVLSAISNYDGLEGHAAVAAEFLANAIGQTEDPEIRDAALAALSQCAISGPHYLRVLVEKPLPSNVRERALELYIESDGGTDMEFLKGIYLLPSMVKDGSAKAKKPTKKKKKSKKGSDSEMEKGTVLTNSTVMRDMALKAFGPRADVKELEGYFEKERKVQKNKSSRLIATMLKVLAAKNAPNIDKLAEDELNRITNNGEIRSAAAEILAKNQGIKMLPVFVEIAKSKATTPVSLNWTMARLLRDMDAEQVTEELVGRLGKAKKNERIFILDAMPVPCEDGVVKKATKGLKSKLPVERIATIRFLARAGGEKTVKNFEKNLKKEKDPAVVGAYLEGLGELYKKNDEWIGRLHEWSETGKPAIKTAASMEIMRMGREEDLDRIIAWLDDESWSMRQAALVALEGMDDNEVLQPIIKRMSKETGRLAYEFGETLFRLTGKNYGMNFKTWQAWYDQEGEDVDLLSKGELREAIRGRALKAQKERSRPARFFGMEIRSARVIFIVDVSGSMDWELKGKYVGERGEIRMDRAKEELVAAIDGLKKGTRFDIVAFSGGVDNWAAEPLAGSQEPNHDEAKEWVKALGAGGGTNLYGSLEKAFEDPDVDTIVVLSDGEPSVGDIIDPGSIREAVQAMNTNRNVRIHTIALGGTLQILEWLAEDSGGRFIQIE
ncbi:MAG: VWA domain-containing protein [Planctomycetota bacterium]|nr:VWA domain-containing protein [Planctomycetota bacterium]